MARLQYLHFETHLFMKEITFQLSKKKTTLLFLGAIGFVILSFWLIQIAETQTRFSPMFVRIISFVGMIFFGICGIYAFTKFFDKKPGLIISDKGITDNSSAVSAGLIKWENITNVGITEIYGQKILTIEVNNADEILSRQSGFKKLLMNLNKNYFSSPIQISANTLKCNFQELYNTIKEQLTSRHTA